MKRFLKMGAFLVLVITQTSNLFGLTGSQITVSNGTGPYFYADDGNCGSRELPNAAYLIINVENLSTTDTLWAVRVKMTSNSNVDFKMLNHAYDSTITISRILPQSTEGAFFYMQYPCTKNQNVTFDFVLSDGFSGTVNYNTALSTTDIQPAGAGGAILDQNVVGLDAMGILLADTVTFEFGNYNGGEMVFQPNGDTLFPADNIELLGCKIVESDFSACGLTVGTINTLYFNNGSGCGGGSGNIVKVVFYFINSLFNDTAAFKPYAAMRSGGQIKYSNNYASNGLYIDSFGTSSAANKFVFTKTASCGICDAGDTVTFTVNIENTATEDLMFDRMYVNLPVGYSFYDFDSTSDINDLNSSVKPEAGAQGTILFEGLVAEQVFPYRSYLVPALDSIKLVYKVILPGTTSQTVYTAEGMPEVGTYVLDTASVQTCVGCSALPISLVSFNGQKDGWDILLRWVTSAEINNKEFVLYRMGIDGIEQYLSTVPGAGTSFNLQEYSVRDYGAALNQNGNLQYKLVQEDFDGKSEAFYTSVQLDNEKNDRVNVFPHPFKEKLNIDLSDYTGEVIVRLTSLQGQLLLEEAVIHPHGIITLNTEHLNSQVCFLDVLVNGLSVAHSTLIKP